LFGGYKPPFLVIPGRKMSVSGRAFHIRPVKDKSSYENHFIPQIHASDPGFAALFRRELVAGRQNREWTRMNTNKRTLISKLRNGDDLFCLPPPPSLLY
jgi:hypothetical protein